MIQQRMMEELERHGVIIHRRSRITRISKVGESFVARGPHLTGPSLACFLERLH